MSTPYHKAIEAMYCAQRAYEANQDKNHPETIAATKHFFDEANKLPCDIFLGLLRIILTKGKWGFNYFHPALTDLWGDLTTRVRDIETSQFEKCVKAAQFHIDLLYHLQDITERYGKDAATMFKLSEGNIDPRGEQ